jgi:hypothetical protein
LLALIKDITNEACNKDKKAKGSSALYGGRPNPDKGKGKEKGKGDDKKKDLGRKKEGSFCKNCKNQHALYSSENCFVTNKKL